MELLVNQESVLLKASKYAFACGALLNKNSLANLRIPHVALFPGILLNMHCRKRPDFDE